MADAPGGRTAFLHDERCLWHAGGDYAFTLPLGGLVQPLAAGGLPEAPEAKRRLVNLLRVTGLMGEMDERTAPPAGREALERVHPARYLDRFERLSAERGGELGPRAPFAAGGYAIADLSAGLAVAALRAVLRGEARGAYALTRPPGHHCLPEGPNGFCLLANVAVAVEAALAEGLAARVAVLDWDVHHGNGTEAIFLRRPEVLTVSIHQERNYPLDTGAFAQRGEGPGEGANLNVPLPPGSGHAEWLMAAERVALPAIRRFRPDAIVVASGYDASAFDPLGRMLCGADTFGALTGMTRALAEEICGGRLALCHEGGYSEVHAPFCAHAAVAALARSRREAPDPFGEVLAARQPGPAFARLVEGMLGEMAEALGLR